MILICNKYLYFVKTLRIGGRVALLPKCVGYTKFPQSKHASRSIYADHEAAHSHYSVCYLMPPSHSISMDARTSNFIRIDDRHLRCRHGCTLQLWYKRME